MTLRRLLLPGVAAAVLAAAPPAAAQTTTICHATGDPNTPYQAIEVQSDETIGHLQHDDDLVPAPPGGCPAQLVQDDPGPVPTPAPAVTQVPDVVPPPQGRPYKRRPARRAPSRPAPAASAPAAGAPAPRPATAHGNLRATATVKSDTLPMTGGEVPGIALVGLGFLLAGAGMRLRYDW